MAPIKKPRETNPKAAFLSSTSLVMEWGPVVEEEEGEGVGEGEEVGLKVGLEVGVLVGITVGVGVGLGCLWHSYCC